MKKFIVTLSIASAAMPLHASDIRAAFNGKSSLSIGAETIPGPMMLKLYKLNADKSFAVAAGKVEEDVNVRMRAITRLIQLVSQQGLPGKYLWSPEDNNTVNDLWNQKKLAELDIFLSWKSLKIARYFLTGLASPEGISADIKLKSESLTEAELAQVAEFLKGSLTPEQIVSAMTPKNETYANLVSVYQDLLKKTEPDSGPVPSVVLKAGVKNSSAIRYMKDRLAFLGFANAGSDDAVDATLTQSIREFQAAHGLKADGIVGQKSWAHLSKSLASLKTQALLNIDRLRWVPTQLEGENVWVNLASQQLVYKVNGQNVMAFRTINGRPDRRTPMIKDSISYAEMNPTWTVPFGIMVKDKLPALRENPGMIEQWKMKVIDDVTGREVSAHSVNWKNVNSGNLRYTLIQRPGAHNALGLVKFPMTNPYAIYLHDTNARELFAEDERQLSSGCVRLQFPFEFAEATIRNPSQWNVAQIQQFTSTGADKPTKVDFKRKIPVYLMYTTIEKDPAGRIVSRSDSYGIDRDHYAAIKKFLD